MYRRRNNVNYCKTKSEERVPHREEVDGFTDMQFVKSEQKVPWKTVFFITTFMIAGTVCLTFAILISTGYFDEKYADRSWPLLIMGILMLIPGGYYAYVLVCICLGRSGFSCGDIPEL